MNSAEILELLKYGEHINLECKKAESNLPKSIWETYSSFANTDGGVILFGVEEHMKEIDTDISRKEENHDYNNYYSWSVYLSSETFAKTRKSCGNSINRIYINHFSF